MEKGWIKTYRSFLKWEWYNDINTKTLFIHLLLTANYEDKKWRGIDVKRGELITSLSHLSEETRLSVRQVRTSLNKLKSTGEITTKPTSKYTLISIVNYSNYQDVEESNDKQKDTPSNKQETSKRQGDDKQVTTTKELKNKRIISNKNKKGQTAEDFLKRFGRKASVDENGKETVTKI